MTTEIWRSGELTKTQGIAQTIYLRKAIVFLLLGGALTFGCAPATPSSESADKLEAAARQMQVGETVVVTLSPVGSDYLIVVAPSSGLPASEIERVPAPYRDMLRRTHDWAGTRRIAFVTADRMESTTISVLVPKAMSVTKRAGQSAEVSLVRTHEGIELVSVK